MIILWLFVLGTVNLFFVLSLITILIMLTIIRLVNMPPPPFLNQLFNEYSIIALLNKELKKPFLINNINIISLINNDLKFLSYFLEFEILDFFLYFTT